MQLSGLAHIGLFVTDMQRSVRFYTEMLDFKVIWKNVNPSPEGDIAVTFVQNGNLVLELVRFPNPQTRTDGWFDHIALAITDLEQVMAELSARGIAFEAGSREDAPQVFEKGSRWVLFRGPDNEHIELNEVL